MESISPPNRNYLVAKPEAQRPSYNIYPDHRLAPIFVGFFEEIIQTNFRAGLFPEAVNQAQFERQAERPLKYGGQSPDRWATQDNREGDGYCEQHFGEFLEGFLFQGHSL